MFSPQDLTPHVVWLSPSQPILVTRPLLTLLMTVAPRHEDANCLSMLFILSLAHTSYPLANPEWNHWQ